MSRHCWVIEVPTARGGWRIEEVEMDDIGGRLTLQDVQRYCPTARIVKYVPEVEDE